MRRRSMAKWMCDQQAIEVNGSAAKAGRFVGAGDRIRILRPQHPLVIEVLSLPAAATSRRPIGGALTQTPFYRIVSGDLSRERLDSRVPGISKSKEPGSEIS